MTTESPFYFASVAPGGAIRALYGGPGYLEQGFNDANASTVPAGTSFTPFVYAAALEAPAWRDAWVEPL